MDKEKLNQRRCERLSQYIYTHNLKSKDIADSANYTPQYISEIKRGKATPTLEAWNRIANALHIKVEYLLCESDFPTEEERIAATHRNRTDRDAAVYSLIESLGYEIISMKTNEDGTKESMHRPFSRITINKSIDEFSFDDSEEKILEKAKNSIPTRIFILKAPSGKQTYIEMDELIQLEKNIRDYAKFQCDLPFHRFEK